MSAELIWTQKTQKQYAQNIKAIQTNISALWRTATMVTKNRPVSIGPLSYTHVVAIIPIMPQAIKQSIHKPTEIHKITVCISDTTDHKEILKQNNQVLVHKL